MNKQEMASRIWETANGLRGNMEANEYKDYILGFIFYKYLSENEIQFLLKNNWEQEDIEELKEENEEDVNFIQERLGYFIGNKNLFHSWIKLGTDFSVDNVRTALSAFHRNINPEKMKIFGGIFRTLEQGLSKLGDTATSQTRAIRQLISLVDDVPTNNKEYDTLGYIYEYLISQFAAGAGKKSGEFFTPHEVSILKSEIVANHLKDRENIQIYDPTSGSGSLLLNIGNALSKYIEDKDNIKYYAQEKIYNTYNLTRMNLVMHDILPDNMVVRNGDTLEHDFPYFDESDPEGTYEPVFVDAVVSNPPYSMKFDTEGKEYDPRFKEYGLAPKSKADYAFLLHCLYHIKRDGIVTIVLPHGVLFRGGEEETIRKNLILRSNIETVIGLPANIFFGTSIPTIILVLKKRRDTNDILFVDASKGFIKQGNKNVLRTSDIQRIVDTVTQRKEVRHYSSLVPLKVIEENNYNLNIPRYVDSGEEQERWDLYATMYGGIPKVELDRFEELWKTMPNLYKDLFKELNSEYVELKSSNVQQLMDESEDVADFKENYYRVFDGYENFLFNTLIEQVMSLKITQTKEMLTTDLFKRYENIPLLDPYQAYQYFADIWEMISIDIEVLQQESFDSIRVVDPNMVMKKKDGKKVEVQEGWKGRILPFELVQTTLLKEQKEVVDTLESRQFEIQDDLNNIIEGLSEENGEYAVLNDNNDKFVLTSVQEALNEQFQEIKIPELDVIASYQKLLNSKEKVAVLRDFIATNPEVNWDAMEQKKDGTPTAKGLKEYIQIVQRNYMFTEGTYGSTLSTVFSLLEEEKHVKKQLKEQTEALHLLTKETIENLSDDQAKDLLNLKWIQPYTASLIQLPTDFTDNVSEQLIQLHNKYEKTLVSLQDEIENSTKVISDSLEQLQGSEFDLKGINELKVLLKGGNVHE